MRGDEGEMESAYKKSCPEHDIAGMSEGAADGLGEGNVADVGGVGCGCVRACLAAQQGNAECHGRERCGDHDESHAPIEPLDEPCGEERQHHLSGGTHRRGDAEIVCSLFHRSGSADDGEDDSEGGSGDSHADQHSGADVLRQRRGSEDADTHAEDITSESEP